MCPALCILVDCISLVEGYTTGEMVQKALLAGHGADQEGEYEKESDNARKRKAWKAKPGARAGRKA
jgi:hypothetical protein